MRKLNSAFCKRPVLFCTLFLLSSLTLTGETQRPTAAEVRAIGNRVADWMVTHEMDSHTFKAGHGAGQKASDLGWIRGAMSAAVALHRHPPADAGQRQLQHAHVFPLRHGPAAEAAQVVEDVHAFEGHIACDPDARSEIVVPVRDAGGRLAAVLDVDSHQPGAFDEADREGLEQLALVLSPHLGA